MWLAIATTHTHACMHTYIYTPSLCPSSHFSFSLPLHRVSREEVRKNTSRDTQKHPLPTVSTNPTKMAATPPEMSRDFLLTPYQATRGGSPRQTVHRTGEVETRSPFSPSPPGSHRRKGKTASRDRNTHTPAVMAVIPEGADQIHVKQCYNFLTVLNYSLSDPVQSHSPRCRTVGVAGLQSNS